MTKRQFRTLPEDTFWQPLSAYLEQKNDNLPSSVIDNIVLALLKILEAQQRSLKKLDFSVDSLPQR